MKRGRPILPRDSNKGINGLCTYVWDANEISVHKKISRNLLEFATNEFYGIGKRGGIDVGDGPSVSATMENDWKTPPRLRVKLHGSRFLAAP